MTIAPPPGNEPPPSAPGKPQAPGAAPGPDKDPIVYGSLSRHLAWASLALVLATAWGFYDEIVHKRPWNWVYQPRFAVLYQDFLKGYREERLALETEIRSSDEYKAFDPLIAAAEEKAKAPAQDLADQLDKVVNPQIAALTRSLQDARARVGATTYDIETSSSERTKDRLRRKNENFKKKTITVKLPTGDGKKEKKDFTFEQLTAAFAELKARKAEINNKRADVLRPAVDLRKQQEAYLALKLNGLSAAQVDGLINKARGAKSGIRQIHVADVNLVDRCESCHLGIREPVRIRAEDMVWKGVKQEVFVSHPNKALLQTHDPEKFGCSPCHGGNGIGTISVEKGHGRYEHWLWPMYDKNHMEAGCAQCHDGAMVLENAPILNKGKELFYVKACWGCHPRKGYDADREALKETTQALNNLAAKKAGYASDRKKAEAVFDDREATDADIEQAKKDVEVYTLKMSGVDAEAVELESRKADLFAQRKDPGPNLKDVRAKLKPEWIPVWLADPRAFRPSTKMPQFRLPKEHLEAISAFIWQSGLEPRLASQPAGSPIRGKALFLKRGCQGCHSLGTLEDGRRNGGSFAADLSRVGEKASYDYLVRWIANPRERSYPYCADCGRDITPADYAKKGLPYRFDAEHNLCPNCGHVLDIQNHTPMPDLRLAMDEVRDIASFLSTQKSKDAVYEAAPFLKDKALFDKGKALVRHYGCFGCHEIAGLEKEGRIGTDLTKEGSKPIERLDFGRTEHDAKHEGWYSHLGYFEHKLHQPEFFDKGKEKNDPLEKLRMPNFGLSDDEIRALTTFLLGSVDSRYPPRFYHNPKGADKDIEDGWWVIRKYNCVGCHQVAPWQKPDIQGLPQYEGDNKVLTPPNLVGVGARLTPEFLEKFLKDPSLGNHAPRNGVRSYLDIRMPTFYLTDEEVQKLVRFFNALSEQPLPYMAKPVRGLSGAELTMARDAVSSSDCLKCHAGGPATGSQVIAPDLHLAKTRLRPEWIRRWLVDPSQIMPGTRMPSGLFVQKDGRWVIAGVTPASMAGYAGDHTDLFVRYLMQF